MIFRGLEIFAFGPYLIGRRPAQAPEEFVPAAAFCGIALVSRSHPVDQGFADIGPGGSRITFGHFAGDAPPGRSRAGIVVAVLRDAAPAWLRDPDSMDGELEIDTPGLRLLASHLWGVAELADSMGVADGAAAAQAAFALGRGAFDGVARMDAGTDHGRAPTPFEAAIGIIDRDVLDRSLTIDRVASELGVSRATLFRLFQPVGGVQAYVHRRRLELAREALVRRAGGRPTIADVAHLHGFASESHFSRAFRKVYGYSPGAVIPHPLPALRASGTP